MKNTDGGYSWTFQDSIMSPYLGCLHFIDENNGWIAGDNIYSTTDEGQSWQCCTNFDNSDVIVDLFFYDNNNAWALVEMALFINMAINNNFNWRPILLSCQKKINTL